MRRALNEIEYLSWCVGQPYNIVIAVRLRGGVQPGELVQALGKAQRRHPLLGVSTEPGPDGLPWFSSDGVGAIPLEVLPDAEPQRAAALAERELSTPFAMDAPGSPRLPLMRVWLLLPSDPSRPSDVILTVQHVVADGLSMLFLVRDLLRFIEAPDAPVEVLDAPGSAEEILPARARRRLPQSALLVTVVFGLARAYAWLRSLLRAKPPPRQRTQRRRTWELTPEQTTQLRARCRREGVSLQSAICAAFLPAFRAIHTPVNLRPLLARPVGESVGLFVGAAEVRLRYRATRGFWDNARRFHRRLRRQLRDPFRIFRTFSRAVPAELARKLGPLMVAISSHDRAFAVTDLGDLDREGGQLQGKGLKVESFSGSVTAIFDSSVLTVYTLEGRLRLQFLANEAAPAETELQDEAERAVRLLLNAGGDHEPERVGRRRYRDVGRAGGAPPGAGRAPGAGAHAGPGAGG